MNNRMFSNGMLIFVLIALCSYRLADNAAAQDAATVKLIEGAKKEG